MYEHGPSEVWFPSYGLLTGTAGDRLLGSRFFPPRLAGVVYCDSLHNVFPGLLQDVDLQSGVHLWSMWYGVEPLFLLALRDFLNNVFLEKWTRQVGPTAWPALSPGGSSSLPFVLQKSVTSRACNNECKIG